MAFRSSGFTTRVLHGHGHARRRPTQNANGGLGTSLFTRRGRSCRIVIRSSGFTAPKILSGSGLHDRDVELGGFLSGNNIGDEIGKHRRTGFTMGNGNGDVGEHDSETTGRERAQHGRTRLRGQQHQDVEERGRYCWTHTGRGRAGSSRPWRSRRARRRSSSRRGAGAWSGGGGEGVNGKEAAEAGASWLGGARRGPAEQESRCGREETPGKKVVDGGRKLGRPTTELRAVAGVVRGRLKGVR